MKKRPAVPAAAIVLLAAALIAAAVWANAPERRAARFAEKNGAAFAALAASGQALPAEYGGAKVRTWGGAHVQVDFVLGYGIGDRQYWGAYYSPDDVPLPFQNADVPLTPNGDGCWTWQGEGDNRGTTKKISENWYYFEAGF